jgi:hypothetical protein
MICKYCNGDVVWRGAFSNLTHTQRLSCGETNCQRIYEDGELTNEVKND